MIDRTGPAVLFLMIILAVMLSACAGGEGRHFVDKDAIPDPRLKVAVLPFENLTDNPNAGVIVSQLMTAELYTRQVFLQMEESELRRVLAAKKVDMNRLFDSTVARQVGAMLGVDGVIIGSVAEYAYQHGLREEPAVGFSMRMVRVGDGEVIWSASRSDIGSGFLQRDSLVHVAQRSVRRTVNIMMRSPGPQMEAVATESYDDDEPMGTEDSSVELEEENMQGIAAGDEVSMKRTDESEKVVMDELPVTDDLTMKEVQDDTEMYQDNEVDEIRIIDEITLYEETPELLGLGDMAMLTGDGS
ncbi:MAG: hypothetical protein HQL53_01425 [Magnetococcales bacterium]|nr:hypothetical protein [Magnetococcales bacterium]